MELRLRVLVEDYRQVNRELTAWMRRKKSFQKNGIDDGFVMEYIDSKIRELKRRRDEVKARIEEALKQHPLWQWYLSSMWGFPSVQAAAIIAYIRDPRRFPTISKLWKFSGFAPGQGPHTGDKRYHVKLKTAVWQAVQAMLMARSQRMQALYRRLREQEDQKHPELSKAHRHMRTMRKLCKILLYCIWYVWNRQLGVNPPKPYAFNFLKHAESELIPPEYFMEKRHAGS